MNPSDRKSAPERRSATGNEVSSTESSEGAATPVVIKQGGAQNVSGEKVTIRQGGAVGVRAKAFDLSMGGIVGAQARTVSMTASEAGGILAGGDVTMDQSAAGVLAASGKVTMDQCGSGVVMAPEVHAENCGTAFLVAGRVNGSVKTLFGPRESLIFGVVAGALAGLAILGLSTRKNREDQ